MTDAAVDVFARFEHEGWERVAEKYDAAWTSLTSEFVAPLLAAVAVGPGMRVLDIACGPGHLTATAARLGADVVGLDFSGAMIRIAHTRHPELEFHEGDAQALPFPAVAFDRVVSNFGVLHLSDPDCGFAEAHRVLQPGGRYGFTVWARPELNPGMRLVAEAVEMLGVPPVGIPEGPDRLRFADAAECRRALAAVGFDSSTTKFETHAVAWTVPTASYLFEAQRDAGVRVAAVLARQPADRLAMIQAAVEREVRRYASPGGYAIPMVAHVVTAALPEA